MALRQYQDAARTAIEAQWQSGVKKTLLVLVTGGGKTIIFAKVIENCVRNGERVLVLAHRGELLEQAADKLQMVTGLGCAVEKADQSCQGSWFRVVVGSVQTLMQEKRLSQFPPDYFDTIVVDEAHHCCPAGTMVGNMSIEHIQPGDVVPAYNHATGKAASRHVIGVMSRRVSEIYQLRLSNGTTLCCTGGHPIWNGTAYVRCNTLRAGDWIFEKGGNPLELSEIHEAQDMLDLRDSIYPEIMELNDDPILLGSMRSDCERSEAQDRKRDMRRLRESFCPVGKKAIPSHKRANLLFKRMQRKVCANRQGENDVGNQQAIRVGADEDQKPYAKRRIERKDEKQPKGTPIYPSGRERADDETARRACAGASRNLLGALRNRISNCYERREEVRRQDTKLLQGRYRLPECQAVDRGGWEKPFDGGGERERRTENRDLAPIRVVGITVHQRGSGREFERLCPGGVVYNLEV
ncbi:MAG: DEAD/DEAH box helicase family protein, partial [Clostridia bacterium]